MIQHWEGKCYEFSDILGTKLKQGMKYSFFVRVWYSITVFGDFKSDGVTISSQPPITTVVNGAAVYVKNNSICLTISFMKVWIKETDRWFGLLQSRSRRFGGIVQSETWTSSSMAHKSPWIGWISLWILQPPFPATSCTSVQPREVRHNHSV